MTSPSQAPRSTTYDAIVIGSGPNGLAAAITLAQAGRQTLVVEARETIGGGTRSAELTLPGFVHDVCSAVHPMAQASPFFCTLPLAQFGLDWAHPEILLAHPLEGGRAAVMERDLAATAARLPGKDGQAYLKALGPTVRNYDQLLPDLLGPPYWFPRHPFKVARFGIPALCSAWGMARSKFASDEAQVLLAGNGAHSILPLEAAATSAVGLMLMAAGHTAGWPVAKGGSQQIANALAAYFVSLGGEIITAQKVARLDELPKAKAYLFDTGPRAMAEICGDRLPEGFRKRLRKFRYGPGAYKLDLALSAPIPWQNADCRRAGTVHVGGALPEMAESERLCWQGKVSEKPFVLLAQQSVCDPTRAPAGQHTCWAYCHVPSGFDGDITDRILNQIERYAPGFRDTILATHVMRPADLEKYNPNYIGGDIIGGIQSLWQMIARPVLKWNPYATPARDIYLCSSSTPPGGGVHGMCGWHAARTASKLWR